MPRVNVVKKSRKDQGTCKCGAPLPVGSPYIWWKFNFGRIKYRRCTAAKCRPKPSELTQSEFYGLVYSTEEMLSGMESPTAEDLTQALEDAMSNLEEARDLRHEAADAIEEYFEGSEKAEELRGEGDQADEWYEELDQVKDEAQELTDGDYEFAEDETLEDKIDELREQASSSYPF